MKFKSLIEKAAEKIFVDKYNCIICGKELPCENRYAMCVNCMVKLIYIKYPCAKCGKPLNGNTEYCLMCENRKRDFNKAYSALEYWGEVENLVYALKFGGKRYIAKYLASFLADKYIEEGLYCDFVTAVPLHTQRLKERGYNQAELLARGLSERLGLTYKESLDRVKATGMQAKLPGKEREKNVEDAFFAKDNYKGMKILIVDDILTTGATLSAAATALKKAGAIEVTGITLCNVRDRLISVNADNESKKHG